MLSGEIKFFLSFSTTRTCGFVKFFMKLKRTATPRLLFVRIFPELSLRLLCPRCRLSKEPTKFVACKTEEESRERESLVGLSAGLDTTRCFRASMQPSIFHCEAFNFPVKTLRFNFMLCFLLHAQQALYVQAT